MEYKIEVSLNPANDKYCWVIFGRKEGTIGWCNHGFGWADRPELAFKEAHDHYLKHIDGMRDEILKRFA